MIQNSHLSILLRSTHRPASMATVSAASAQAVSSNRRQPVARHVPTMPEPRQSHRPPWLPACYPPMTPKDPGFFPAITHFTNSITALPKEMIRHYTMLKEVDAKIYAPEAELGQFLAEALRSPPPAAPADIASQGIVHPYIVPKWYMTILDG